MKVQRYTRRGNRTMCFMEAKHDMIFVGFGEHEDPKEAERLAYEDAYRKATVISIKSLAMYRLWKHSQRKG